MNKSNAAVNTATLNLTVDYCGGKLKYLEMAFVSRGTDKLIINVQ